MSAARGEPVGAYFADASRTEAASVHAFGVLRADLAANGAPSDLVTRARAAEADEVRHARVTAKLARRYGVEEGPWAQPPQIAAPCERSAETIALENAVEGCVNETYAALLAMWQAEHAVDRNVRAAMRAIAEDETRHAALACAVAEWLEPMLCERAQRRVDASVTLAVEALVAGSSRQPQQALIDAGVLPDREGRAALARALIETLKATRLLRQRAA